VTLSAYTRCCISKYTPYNTYSDSLRAGRSRDRIPLEAKFSAPVKTGPGAHSASCRMVVWSFSGVKRPGRGVHHQPPSSKKVKLSHYRPDRPLGFQEIEAPEFLDNRHSKVVRLSALRTGRLYLQDGFLVLISVRG
jgi:hypothetical protein